MSATDVVGHTHAIEPCRLVDAIPVGDDQDGDAMCQDRRRPEELIQLLVTRMSAAPKIINPLTTVVA
jgi:hypothetical protein